MACVFSMFIFIYDIKMKSTYYIQSNNILQQYIEINHRANFKTENIVFLTCSFLLYLTTELLHEYQTAHVQENIVVCYLLYDDVDIVILCCYLSYLCRRHLPIIQAKRDLS